MHISFLNKYLTGVTYVIDYWNIAMILNIDLKAVRTLIDYWSSPRFPNKYVIQVM
jgi:hypothetical protein